MSNEEFRIIMNLKKKFTQDNIMLPKNGESQIFDVESGSTKDKFYIDVDRRGRIELSRFKLQNRYAMTKLPLVRIDIDSPPHLNPDGTRTSRNHIHVYRETENDTGNLPWAYDLEAFNEISCRIQTLDFMQVFYAFCEYCNIETNNIQGVI